MSYMKLLNPTIAYIQAKQAQINQIWAHKKQVRAHKKQTRAHEKQIGVHKSRYDHFKANKITKAK